MNIMRKFIIPVSVIGFGTAGFSTFAYADCTAQLEQISAVMESAKLSDAERAVIEQAKTMAMEKQTTGDDEACQAELAEAKSILQIE